MQYIGGGRRSSAVDYNSKPWYLLGIVSFGTCGGNDPGIFTRLHRFIFSHPFLGKKPPAKKARFKPTAGGPGGGDDLEEAQRQAAAMETLTQYFPEVFYAMVERRKKRKIMLEEVPLKAQLFALQGLSHFLLFHQKMEFRDKLSENTNKIFAVTQLDNEWYSFPNCGTVIFGLTTKSEIAKKAVTADQQHLRSQSCSGGQICQKL